MTRPKPQTDPKVYGWCPGALRPMMSGDGLVVRLRPTMGRLSQEQMRSIAQLSQRFGNGLLDLSARANLQMRGIAPENHPLLIQALRDIDLVDQDEETEARRNVILAPFWRAGDEGHRMAQKLTQALTQRDTAGLNLPGKFGFAVDCGAQPVLHNTAADIRIERHGAHFLLVADGASTGLPVTIEAAPAAAIELSHWFLNQGGAPTGRGRMRSLIARRGPPNGHQTPRSTTATRTTPGQVVCGRLVALEFGQIPAATLAALSEIGPVRLTPWRMLLVEDALSVPNLPGLILDATDPRLQVAACTGAPSCLQALSTTRDLARDLAPHIPKDTFLHVSGCAKGCAHPAQADLVLTASGPDTFDLIRHGTAGDQPLKETLSAATLRATPAILTEGS